MQLDMCVNDAVTDIWVQSGGVQWYSSSSVVCIG